MEARLHDSCAAEKPPRTVAQLSEKGEHTWNSAWYLGDVSEFLDRFWSQLVRFRWGMVSVAHYFARVITVISQSFSSEFCCFRPSLFDDFVEYERERLRNAETGDDEDDTNNNHLNMQQHWSISNGINIQSFVFIVSWETKKTWFQSRASLISLLPWK